MRIASVVVLLTAVLGSEALGQQPDSITQRQAEIEAHPEYVVAPLASLRSGPSLDSSIVRIVERGTTTYVQASTGWWLRVRIRTEAPPAGGPRLTVRPGRPRLRIVAGPTGIPN